MDGLRTDEAVQVVVIFIGAVIGMYCGWAYFSEFDHLPARTYSGAIFLCPVFGVAGGVLANVAWLAVWALVEMWRGK